MKVPNQSVGVMPVSILSPTVATDCEATINPSRISLCYNSKLLYPQQTVRVPYPAPPPRELGLTSPATQRSCVHWKCAKECASGGCCEWVCVNVIIDIVSV